MAIKVGMVSLGCSKNQVDAEIILAKLKKRGYQLHTDSGTCDVVIINTCGFIDAAKSEAIDHILAMGKLKQAGRIGKILVTGCLAQRYQDEILKEMPEVDGVLGTGSYFDVVPAALEQDLALPDGEDAGAHGDDLVVTDFAAKGFDVIHVHCLSCGFF